MNCMEKSSVWFLQDLMPSQSCYTTFEFLVVRTFDIFSLLRELVLGFGYCLMVSCLFCFLCFMLKVRRCNTTPYGIKFIRLLGLKFYK